MTKYTVLNYYTKTKFSDSGVKVMTELQTDQVAPFFDTIQEAEKARVVLLNENFSLKPQELRVVQYDFK